MEASKVYYTDFRCPVGTSLLEKLRRVCIAAGSNQNTHNGSSFLRTIERLCYGNTA